jgi:DNA polymerase
VLNGFTPVGMTKIKGISVLHGEVQVISVQGAKYTIMPLYHPAAMLYNPKLRETLAADFEKLGQFLKT